MSSEKDVSESSVASDGSSVIAGDPDSLLLTTASGRQFRLRPGEGPAAIEWLRNLPQDERPKMIPDVMDVYVLPRVPGSTDGVSPLAVATEARLLRIAEQFEPADRGVLVAEVRQTAG